MILEWAQMVILGASHSSCLSVSCAYVESSKATQFSSSGLCKILEVFAEGAKWCFGSQIALGFIPDAAIAGCGALEKLFQLFKPQFFHL